MYKIQMHCVFHSLAVITFLRSVNNCEFVRFGLSVGEQDCAVLGDIVAASPGSLDAALEEYEKRRKPDAHALGIMDHQASHLISP